ncbi:hypothetical protein U9M48_001703 [Paspalum notatum var. saurae]|uniref:Uncharacterized protein n=1 Tax=Paspalum notatum var. saurae TaxID=547442 RepID=A0AAQ3PPB5_PASNO
MDLEIRPEGEQIRSSDPTSKESAHRSDLLLRLPNSQSQQLVSQPSAGPRLLVAASQFKLRSLQGLPHVPATAAWGVAGEERSGDDTVAAATHAQTRPSSSRSAGPAICIEMIRGFGDGL